MNKFLIDISKDCKQGGYCNVLNIINHENLVFKQFDYKKNAKEAYKYQAILAQFDLAPKIHSDICKLEFAPLGTIAFKDKSLWGFVTEKAEPIDDNNQNMILIQDLVEHIAVKADLKFWDCHWYNVGLVKRGKKKKLVCIDTGKESFDGYSNAWGNPDPGPKCSYCDTYICKCEE